MNPGDVIDGMYVLDRKLGQGGLGEVWLARYPGIKKRYTFKFLHNVLYLPEFKITGFIRVLIAELRSVFEFRHPNAVGLYDAGVHADAPFLVADYVEGKAVKDLIYEEPLENKEVVRIANDVLAALAAAHAKNILHCDIKPSKLLVAPARHTYVRDFGITKALEKALGGGPICTPVYAAPEHFDPGRFGPVTPATDLYSLAVTMYHMATGQPPFMGTGYEVLRRHMDAAPPRVAEVNPQITPALDAVIMKALAKEPRERFASADEMAAALRPQILV